MQTSFISFRKLPASDIPTKNSSVIRLAAVLCLFAILATPYSIRAQVAGGAVTGTVTGESGASMPGARVSIQDVGSGQSRIAGTNTSGIFSVPDLPPGKYEMTVAASGFTTQLWTEINVTAGGERILNVVMHPGKPEQVVRVVAPPALVSEPCPSVCGSANASTVRDTPLNGRDWAQLATLQAGVTGVQNGSATGGGNTDRGFGAAVSISGSRPDQNSYRLDGISINDYANGAPGRTLSTAHSTSFSATARSTPGISLTARSFHLSSAISSVVRAGCRFRRTALSFSETTKDSANRW